MNRGVITAGIIGILVLIGGGVIYLLGTQMQPESQLPQNHGQNNDTPPSQTPDDTGDQSNTGGSYVDYDPALLANANDGDVVLFFHATWCPTCRILNNNLNAELAEIPADLTILKTDYDAQTELKQKYGVTYQHTLVQVDAQGNLIK